VVASIPRSSPRAPCEFLIADTFTDSLTRLTGEERKAAKTTAFDLQLNPANPGMSFHKIERAKDKNFWSVRVGSDLQLLVHKRDASLLLCYVGHHDKAYAWAERRKLETHPRTGTAQLVEIRETVKEVVVPTYVQQEIPATRNHHYGALCRVESPGRCEPHPLPNTCREICQEAAFPGK
jgi:mRNA-degrading endonuclease RelE of RelBE toxin-antitoxin system